MKILVIGNGFDIAHGLKTGYVDFLRYCAQFRPGMLPGKRLPEKFLKFTQENFWLSYFKRLYWLGKAKGGHWLDFEDEIYNAITRLDGQSMSCTLHLADQYGDRSTQDNLFSQCLLDKKWPGISRARQFFRDGIVEVTDVGNGDNDYQQSPEYCAYLDKDHLDEAMSGFDGNYDFITVNDVASICKKLNEELESFVWAFQVYCQRVIDPLTYERGATTSYRLGSSVLDTNDKSEFYVLSFNYTHTLDIIYGNQLRNIPMYVNIHGEIEPKATLPYWAQPLFDAKLDASTGIVMGTRDLPGTMMEEFNVFQKSNQRHRFNTLVGYQRLLKELKKFPGQTKIFVIGHSLGDSDHDILRHLFCADEDASITIFYHKPYSFEQLINQVHKIIDKDDAATRVSFKYQHDPTFGLLVPKTPAKPKKAS